MSSTRIDIVNIVLMIVSCAAAFLLPFEVFLFSYIVLGPLHYLTEISWLHQRNFFTTQNRDYIGLIALCVLLMLLFYVFRGYSAFAAVCLFTAFFYAVSTVVFTKAWHKAVFTAAAVAAGIAIKSTPVFVYTVSIFLPTLIHVFIFTGAFILHGALKGKSVTGAISVLVFLLCGVSCFVFYPQFDFYKVSDRAEALMVKGGFLQLNQAIIQIFELGRHTRQLIFESDAGLGIMRFIAFAYTYHYLNWFSKTEVIKWHMVPRRQLAFVIVIWLLSIVMYAMQSATGFIALYFLSLLHVVLEFPLNYRSFIGIGSEAKLLFTKGAQSPLPAQPAVKSSNRVKSAAKA